MTEAQTEHVAAVKLRQEKANFLDACKAACIEANASVPSHGLVSEAIELDLNAYNTDIEKRYLGAVEKVRAEFSKSDAEKKSNEEAIEKAKEEAKKVRPDVILGDFVDLHNEAARTAMVTDDSQDTQDASEARKAEDLRKQKANELAQALARGKKQGNGSSPGQNLGAQSSHLGSKGKKDSDKGKGKGKGAQPSAKGGKKGKGGKQNGGKSNSWPSKGDKAQQKGKSKGWETGKNGLASGGGKGKGTW